ncbi:hypothetical protein Taro_004051, partial [Colocasia esculenta]|nr:hypothetical protein [Colocasia esculenta]
PGVLARALRHCGRAGAFGAGVSLHCLLIKSGLFRHTFLANNLIAMYVDLRSFGEAQRMFEEMPDRNVVSWTASISAYCSAGNHSEALRTFIRMLDSELEVAPNCFTFSAALKACAMAGDLELGRWIHRRVAATGMESDTVLMNAVIDMYLKCGSLSEARRVFDGISEANTTSWNTMIDGYVKENKMDKAEEMFLKLPKSDSTSFNTIIAGFAQEESPKALEYLCLMHREDLRPDLFTFPCALKTCGSLGRKEMGRQIHCCLVKSGLQTRHCGSSLISMYANCDGIAESMKVYEEFMDHGGSFSEVLALSNAMVSGFVANGFNKSALHLVSQLQRKGMGLDVYTLSSALKACMNLHNLRLAFQIHALVLHCGHLFDSTVGSVLVDLYVKCRNLENALRVFNGLPHKDVVTWAGLISGCVQEGLDQLAFCLFMDMTKSGILIDQFIMSSILKASSSISGLEGGRQVHAQSIKIGFEREKVMVTSLIDMYSKCGQIDDSLSAFKTATYRDTACWTGIIVGCARNGRAKEAIQFFREMVKLGVDPNKITLLGLLSACRHAGWVEEACHIFNSMKEKHGMVPGLEHYCCLVDILNQAGLTREAQMLIDDMPYRPNDNIWNSFLGACGIHGDADTFKLAAECLIPNNTRVHITLSNTYASFGMWDSATRLRQETRKVILKVPGMSWIEVATLPAVFNFAWRVLYSFAKWTTDCKVVGVGKENRNLPY